ncbi:MAG: glycosyltransferase family 39 protein [Burkholderiales bacterium]|nr:glycosyltransferase family 39 protein [Burkholderiales bacterium]
MTRAGGLASPVLRLAAIVAILIVGAFFRFSGLNWDDASQPHPDERYMNQVTSALHGGVLVPAGADEAARAAHRAECLARHRASDGVGGWFDTRCSDLNPANVGYPGYPYGQLPLVAVRHLAEAAAALSGRADAARYDGIALVGRVFSVIADLISIAAIVLLGRLLWGLRIGLLAALLYALSVHAIQVAHFWTVDAAATLLATWSLLFLVRLARFARPGDALAFGVACGLALSSKISVLPLVALLPIAALLAPLRTRFVEPPGWGTRAALALPALLLGLAGTALAFRLASPYAFNGPGPFDLGLSPAFIEQVAASRRLASGVVDVPSNWQWLARSAWFAPGRDMLVWGLGPLAGAAALVGMCVAGWRLLRAVTPMQRARAIVWCWVAGYFFWMGQQWVASMRYFLPIYPALCLLAAAWLGQWWRARRVASAAGRWWPAVGIALVVGSSLAWALAFRPVHTTLHPYVAATHWILRHVPAGVSASLPGADRALLINWPAAGSFGDGIAPALAARTFAPASGTIDRLRLHRVALERASVDGAPPRILLRLLDADGKPIATTAREPLPLDAQAPTPARLHGIELKLVAPVTLQADALYQLQVEVDGGVIGLSGSSIAQEGPWNDSVPTRVPWLSSEVALAADAPSGTASRFAPKLDAFAERFYRSVDLLMVGNDDADKRRRLLDGLDDSEWLVVPNNRFYGAMQWNPLRFPLSIAFYDALFDGSLGFARHRVVASMPRLAGIEIRDQVLPRPGEGVTPRRALMAWAPEEAFNVYDHPTVFIFRKSDAYSRERAERLFAGIELTTIDEALNAPAPQGAGRIDWPTLAARGAPDGLLLREATMPAGDAASRFPQGTAQTFAAILLWYLCSLLLGVIAWAWLAPACAGLADRGWGISRVAGLALPAFAAWLLAQLGVPAWSRGGLFVIVLLLALPAARQCRQAWRTRRHAAANEAALALPSRRYLLAFEAAFVALFAIGLLLRLAAPDLWAPVLGGEKPMDYALLNAVLGSATFPPADPWFSGGRVNYYYFGWVLAGVPIKLLGVAPATAFNLALASWFAMTGMAAAALAWNVCRIAALPLGRRAACIGAGAALVATVLLGNLDGPRAWWPSLEAAAAAIDADPGAPAGAGTSGASGAVMRALLASAERWYWAPSRTVAERAGNGAEINEFPAFSFLYGDLHPHLLAMPLQLALLTLMLAMIRLPLPGARSSACASVHGSAGASASPNRSAPPRIFAASIGALTSALAFTGVGIALLRMTNSWDWPLYLLFGLLAAGLAGWRLPPAWRWPSQAPAAGGESWVQAAAAALALFVVQLLAAWPFSALFATGSVGLSWYGGSRTSLSSWLLMHGWFIAVLVLWAWHLSRTGPRTVPGLATGVTNGTIAGPIAGITAPEPWPWLPRGLRLLRWLGLGYTLAALLWHWFVPAATVPAFALQMALLAWLLELAWRWRDRTGTLLGLLAGAAGCAIAFGVEWLVVGQDMGRMNTFFKFHLQSWLLLAVAAGVAIAHLAALGRAARPALALVLITALPALAFLPLGAIGKMQSRFDASAPWTLNGEAFLEYARLNTGNATIALAGDAQLIDWLRRHGRPHDVILEAQLPEYRWGSRIASFTGLPTLLGYRHHQTQQRPLPALGQAIELRRRNVAALYEAADPQRVIETLRHYRVRFVVVGALERAVYPAAGLAKFAALAQAGALRVAFSAGDDLIYELPGMLLSPETGEPVRGPAW